MTVRIDPKTCEISMTRGDTLRTTVTVKKSDGTDYQLASGDKLVFYLGSTTTSATATPVLTKEIPAATKELHLTAEETKALKASAYFYDIELQKAGGDIDTIINRAKFGLNNEVG